MKRVSYKVYCNDASNQYPYETMTSKQNENPNWFTMIEETMTARAEKEGFQIVRFNHVGKTVTVR